jgi:hypothetical protein
MRLPPETSAKSSARTPKRIAAAVLALAGWFALALQFVLMLGVSLDRLTLAETLIRFFSYFTIQSNILVALVLSAFACKTDSDDWLVHPFVRSAVAVYIAVVGLTYVVVLRSLWAPQGAQWLADAMLHYLMPVGYVVFWIVAVRKDGLRWYDPLLWLIYPAFYLAIILIRGAVSGFYPYPFIDAGQLSPGVLALNAAGMLALFVVLGGLAFGVGRLQGRARRA